jgi:YggT family protein
MPYPVYVLLVYLLNIYSYIVIAAVIVSWLVVANVINTYNHVAAMIVRALYALTEPVFRQIRRVIPPVGGLDFSPFVLLIALWWLADYVLPWIYGRVGF